MSLALDANVLVYAEGIGDVRRVDEARLLLGALAAADAVVALQALGEVYNVLVRKGRTRQTALTAVQTLQSRFRPVATSEAAMANAFVLATEHALTIWDALQLAVAAEAGCRWFLSEDLQDGYGWRGVTVVNPFRQPPHPFVAALLD